MTINRRPFYHSVFRLKKEKGHCGFDERKSKRCRCFPYRCVQRGGAGGDIRCVGRVDSLAGLRLADINNLAGCGHFECSPYVCPEPVLVKTIL